jgi:hypothetical protein
VGGGGSVSADRLSPRVLPDTDTRPAPLNAENYNPALFGTIFVVGALVFGAIALAADELALRLFLGFAALASVLILVIVLRFQTSLTERIVRIDPSVSGLRFVASRSVRSSWLVFCVIGLVPAVLAATVGAPQQPTRTVWGMYAVSALAALWLIQQLFGFRTPPGLTLSQHGIRGVRGTGSIDITWDQLERVEVTSTGGAKLVLHSTHSPAVVIEPRWTGSDPNIIAPIVDYYRTHPAERSALADPRAALRLVEAARLSSRDEP